MKLIEYILQKVLSHFHQINNPETRGLILGHLPPVESHTTRSWYNLTVPEDVAYWSLDTQWRTNLIASERKIRNRKLLVLNHFLYNWNRSLRILSIYLNAENIVEVGCQNHYASSIMKYVGTSIEHVEEFEKLCNAIKEKGGDFEITAKIELDTNTTVSCTMDNSMPLWEFIGTELIKSSQYKD